MIPCGWLCSKHQLSVSLSVSLSLSLALSLLLWSISAWKVAPKQNHSVNKSADRRDATTVKGRPTRSHIQPSFEIRNQLFKVSETFTDPSVHTFNNTLHLLLWLQRVSSLVSLCCKPSQPQRITSVLRETFIKRYIVERTNKAVLKDQSKKMELLREFIEWNRVKSAIKQKKTQEQNKKEWAGSAGLYLWHKP